MVKLIDDPAYGAAVLAALLQAHFPLAGDPYSRDVIRNRDDPLHIAASLNNTSAVATLLEHGAPIHASDFNGDTPLACATNAGAAEAATLLIQAGADVNDCGTCSAGMIWATLAEHAMWAPFSAALHSSHPPMSVPEGRQFMVMCELVSSGAPLEIVREAVASGLYADEIAAPFREDRDYADMADYARMRGREDIASVLSGAA